MVTREEFFKKLEPFHSPSTLLDIQLAYTLAKFGHRAQTRKELDEAGNPVRYFEHPKRVTLILIEEVKIQRPDLIISSLFHDGIEDTRNITPELIEHMYPKYDVVTVIKTLSKVPKEGYLERFNISTDWRPYVVKGCDRLDNLRSLGGGSVEFQERQINETRTKYYPLFDRMVELTPREYKERVQWLRDTIIKTAESHRIVEPSIKDFGTMVKESSKQMVDSITLDSLNRRY